MRRRARRVPLDREPSRFAARTTAEPAPYLSDHSLAPNAFGAVNRDGSRSFPLRMSWARLLLADAPAESEAHSANAKGLAASTKGPVESISLIEPPVS